jgi:uncharacterized protein (DUF1800 family)
MHRTTTRSRDDGRAAAAHVLNRLAFGARPGDIDRVVADGTRHYIDEQLGASIPDPDIELAIRRNQSVQLSASEIVLLHQRDGMSVSSINCPMDDLITAKLGRAVSAKNQLAEVLTDFWYNHFNVNIYAWQPSIPAYERETIRPYVLGRFGDLLRAVAKSPAMMYYLDTFVSTANRMENGTLVKGVNENYGRELLELHTVGVTAGYTQRDVYDAARCFTGWDFGGWHAPVYEYRFAGDNHDVDSKAVFGLTIPRGGGEHDGDALIDYLAAHPKTAHFVSWRLVQRFVSDDPPESLVAKCANAFLRSGGEIRAVLRTMLTSHEFHSPAAVRTKVKTPLEFAASAIRAMEGVVEDGKPLARLLGDMGMPLYECKPPTGWSNRSTDWVNMSAQLYRFNLATALAAGELAGVRVPATGHSSPANVAQTFAHHFLGRDLDEPTRQAIARIQTAGDVPPSTKAMALLLASPEFQYR